MAYIDRDNLIKELSTMYKSPTSAEDFMTVGYDHAIADVVVTVHEQPTFDAQEVVRCKDCCHNEGSLSEPWCIIYECRKSNNGFCDEGKRKETEDE